MPSTKSASPSTPPSDPASRPAVRLRRVALGAVLAATSLALACGDGGGTSDPAPEADGGDRRIERPGELADAQADGGEDASLTFTRQGSVFFTTDYGGEPGTAHGLNVIFAEYAGPSETIGACRSVSARPDPDAGVDAAAPRVRTDLSAGELSFEGKVRKLSGDPDAGLEPFEAKLEAPYASADLLAKLRNDKAYFTDGTTLRVQAKGDEFPAFDVSVSLGLVTLVEPTVLGPQTAPIGQDFVVRLVRNEMGAVVQMDGKSGTALCAVPPKATELRIPAAALAVLGRGEVSLQFRTGVIHETVVDDAKLTLFAGPYVYADGDAGRQRVYRSSVTLQ